MTIQKGQDWGIPITAPLNFEIAHTDVAASRMKSGIPFALSGGDVYVSLGSPQVPKASHSCREVQIDALQYKIEGTNGQLSEDVAFSHVCVGRWFLGRFIAITNCGFIDALNTSPRAHANDGEFDFFELDAEMSLRQRFLAHKKARTGTHLPHPKLRSRRSTFVELTNISGAESLSIDGQNIKDWSSVSVEILPDYWSVLL